MSKNKKPRKKYVPRKIYYPQIVVGTYVFEPLLKAIDQILEYGEVETDDYGVYVYKNTLGKMISIESSLVLYMRYADIYASRNNTTVDVRPLERLRPVILGKSDELNEKDLLEVKACLEVTRQILSKIPPAEHKAIIKVIHENYERSKGQGTLPETGELVAEM